MTDLLPPWTDVFLCAPSFRGYALCHHLQPQGADQQVAIDDAVYKVSPRIHRGPTQVKVDQPDFRLLSLQVLSLLHVPSAATPLPVDTINLADVDRSFDYTKSRKIDRLQCQVRGGCGYIIHPPRPRPAYII